MKMQIDLVYNHYPFNLIKLKAVVYIVVVCVSDNCCK